MKKILLMSIFLSFNALAWGPTGHRVVGEISEKFLEIDTLVAVRKITGGESLAKIANWPDEIKSDPKQYGHTFNWHYTDWKDDDHEHDETHSSGKLLTAINEQVAILKNANSSKADKLFALKFVVHLIGDLHQPLHVGNGLDLGGNNCKVFFHNKLTNLHALWDEGIIDFTNLSFTEFSRFIAEGKTVEQIRKWKEGTIVDWAQESKNLRAQIYPENVKESKEPLSVREYCRNDIKVPQEELPRLSYEYSYKFLPIVEERIYQAGLRLAVVLNNALR